MSNARQYELRITEYAQKDLLDACDYIERVLKNPQAADRLLHDVTQQVTSLRALPERFPWVDYPFFQQKNVRYLAVRNYIIIYRVREELHRVTVLRFVYGKSNWRHRLERLLAPTDAVPEAEEDET